MTIRPSRTAPEKRPLTAPTEAEMRLLQILWDREEGTVEEVVNFRGSTAGWLINLLESSPIKKKALDSLDAYIEEYRKLQE